MQSASTRRLPVNFQDITLAPEEFAELRPRVRSATIHQRDGRRARVIVLAAQGCSRVEIARLLGFSLCSVGVFKSCAWRDCAGLSSRSLDQNRQIAAPTSGVAGISEKNKSRNAQASESENLDGKTQTLPYAFHADIQFVDEHGRAFFRDITVYLRDGSFSSVRELETSITAFLALRNAQPIQYVWSAKGEASLNSS